MSDSSMPGERPGPDPAELDDLHAAQRSHVRSSGRHIPIFGSRRGYRRGLPGAAAAPAATATREAAAGEAGEPLEPDVDGGVDVSVPALVIVKPSMALENAA